MWFDVRLVTRSPRTCRCRSPVVSLRNWCPMTDGWEKFWARMVGLLVGLLIVYVMWCARGGGRRGNSSRGGGGGGGGGGAAAGRWNEGAWAKALAEQARQKKAREEARAEAAAANGNKRKLVIGSESRRTKAD